MELEKFDLEKAKSGHKVVEQEEIYVNLYSNGIYSIFFDSAESAKNAVEPRLNCLGTYKLTKV